MRAWCRHRSLITTHNCIPWGQLECGHMPRPFLLTAKGLVMRLCTYLDVGSKNWCMHCVVNRTRNTEVNWCMHCVVNRTRNTEVGSYQYCKYEYTWMNEWSIIHAFWMLGSKDTCGLQTVPAIGFVIHSEKGWLGVWMDAWVSNPSADTASIANTWYMLHTSDAAVWWQPSAQACACC